jgi:hypothetical protein
MPLPGDELVPNAAGQTTRAVTIEAPVEAVWSWLAQIGRDRGGFYSAFVLERLEGCRTRLLVRGRTRPGIAAEAESERVVHRWQGS